MTLNKTQTQTYVVAKVHNALFSRPYKILNQDKSLEKSEWFSEK